MRLLKSGVLALFATLALSAGPAQAFWPMMLLMMPMMTGGQHSRGTSHESGEEGKETHASPPSQAEHMMPMMMMGGEHSKGSSHESDEGKGTNASLSPHAEKNHPATIDEQPPPSAVRSESPQAGNKVESDPTHIGTTK